MSDSVALESGRVAIESLWTELHSQLKLWMDGGAAVDSGAADRAIEYATLLAWDGAQLPTRVGLTPSGGVAFEWSEGDSLAHLEILDADFAEFSELEGDELIGDGTFRWDVAAQEFRQIEE